MKVCLRIKKSRKEVEDKEKKERITFANGAGRWRGEGVREREVQGKMVAQREFSRVLYRVFFVPEENLP